MIKMNTYSDTGTLSKSIKVAFSALTLLVWQQEEHLAHKKLE